jgi:hypothetical protein
MTTATQISLAAIPVNNWRSPKPLDWFLLAIHDAVTLELVDARPSPDKYDEESVNARAANVRFGDQKYLVVVSNHEGKATAVYQEGEKIA